MENNIQLSLFQEPDIEDITIQWLYDFVLDNLPDIKWHTEETLCGTEITNKPNKISEISIYLGEFSPNVTWTKSKNYIGISVYKKIGGFEGMSLPAESLEEFKEFLFSTIKNFKGVANE